MSFDASSSISFDTAVVRTGGSISVHFDISFTDNLTKSMTIAYTIQGNTCALFSNNSKTTFSFVKNDLQQFDNIFDDPLTFTGDCTDSSFQLKVSCTIPGDSKNSSEVVSYNPAAAALHADLEMTLMKKMKGLVSKGVKEGIDKHVKEFHSKQAQPAAKKAAKKAAPKSPAKKEKRKK